MRDAKRLLRDGEEEWLRDNVPAGLKAQHYPGPCPSRCTKCMEAYHSFRQSRFRASGRAFFALYNRDGAYIEFQGYAVPRYAPKPEFVRHYLHDTPETELLYQSWLTEYLRERVAAARESLKRCILGTYDKSGNLLKDGWMQRGLRKKVSTGTDEDGRPVYPVQQWFQEYETVAVSFSRTTLSRLPEDLLPKEQVSKVWAIVTNEIKAESLSIELNERGYLSVDELYAAAPPESHNRLGELLSEIALVSLRERRASGELTDRIRQWFANAEKALQVRLLNQMGVVLDETTEEFSVALDDRLKRHHELLGKELRKSLAGPVHDTADEERLERLEDKFDAGIEAILGSFSTLLSDEIAAAWQHACWRDGMLQAVYHARCATCRQLRKQKVYRKPCINCRGMYIPFKREIHGRRDGKYCVRQEYALPNQEMGYTACTPLPKDIPFFSVPRKILSEMLDNQRKRLRRKPRVSKRNPNPDPAIQFRYVSVHEAGKSGDHHHVHQLTGFHELYKDTEEESRDYVRRRMREAWHAVSGAVIWKSDAWSRPAREDDIEYSLKYLSKDIRGRQTWLSHNLGLRDYSKERRLIEIGLLPDRPHKVAALEHGGLCWQSPFSESEIASAGAELWVGLLRVKSGRIRDGIVPMHLQVEAVCKSTHAPSVAAAAGIACVQRERGAVDVVPRCDFWLPWQTFEKLCAGERDVQICDDLIRELNLATNQMTGFPKRIGGGIDYHAERHNPAALGHFRRQQRLGNSAFDSLLPDAESLLELLQSPRDGP